MARIDFKNVRKTYIKGSDKKDVINSVNFSIEQGEFTVFVGPSGCGKSTILRMVAGLEDISAGEVLFDNRVINDVSPSDRGVGMVFQSYALYPHMTVEANIAFPLKMSGNFSKEEIKSKVATVAEMLEIEHLLKLKPAQLSGGQRQRVAMGRAIVRQPKVFLLDEPLSNLDTALRVRMRLKLAEFHKKLQCTVIYVTHDQTEAMTLADKVVLLNKGEIEQVGSPRELYEAPASLFVAEFIGSPKMNLIDAKVKSNNGHNVCLNVVGHDVAVDLPNSPVSAGEGVKFGLRPEDLSLSDSEGLIGEVMEKEFMGAESILYIRVNGVDDLLLVRCPGNTRFNRGQSVAINLANVRCYLFDENGKALTRNLTMTAPKPAN